MCQIYGCNKNTVIVTIRVRVLLTLAFLQIVTGETKMIKKYSYQFTQIAMTFVSINLSAETLDIYTEESLIPDKWSIYDRSLLPDYCRGFGAIPYSDQFYMSGKRVTDFYSTAELEYKCKLAIEMAWNNLHRCLSYKEKACNEMGGKLSWGTFIYNPAEGECRSTSAGETHMIGVKLLCSKEDTVVQPAR